MTKDDRNSAIILLICSSIFILYMFLNEIVSPYIAVKKVNKNDFKITCAYVIGKEKDKYGFKYLIIIDGKEYKDSDIFPFAFSLSIQSLKENKLHSFPIRKKRKYFLEIEPNKCKKISYIEIYNFFGFKKFYLYDFIN